MFRPWPLLLSSVGLIAIAGCSNEVLSDRETALLRERVQDCQAQCPVVLQHVVPEPQIPPDQAVGESIFCQVSCFIQDGVPPKKDRFDEVVCVVFQRDNGERKGFVYFHDKRGSSVDAFIWNNPTEQWLVEQGCLPQRQIVATSAG